MQRINDDITISSIDREQHIINLVVKGCPVTAICSPQSNPDIYEQIKMILVDTIPCAAACTYSIPDAFQHLPTRFYCKREENFVNRC